MKQPIRYFSIGLFTATLVLLITFIFFHQPNSTIDNASIEEMISEVESEGYHVLTESEYITFSVNKDNNDQATDDQSEKKPTENKKDEKSNQEDEENTNQKKEDNSEPEEKEISTYTLTVEPNMLGPTISELLVDHNIIDDAEEFNRYLEVEGYAPYIQIGDHKLSSDMSYFEIAEAIAK